MSFSDTGGLKSATMSVFSARTRRRTSDEIEFFIAWLRRPRRVGSVVPSGRALATAMADCIDVAEPGVVVELGGGTGNITRAILDAGVRPSDLVVVEREAALCAVIRTRFPGIRVLRADARRLRALLEAEGIAPVKAVVSSLPLLSMDRREVQPIVAEAFAALAPGGQFLQYTYGPASPIPPEMRARLGIEGARSEWILNNFPPAAVWRFFRRDERPLPVRRRPRLLRVRRPRRLAQLPGASMRSGARTKRRAAAPTVAPCTMTEKTTTT